MAPSPAHRRPHAIMISKKARTVHFARVRHPASAHPVRRLHPWTLSCLDTATHTLSSMRLPLLLLAASQRVSAASTIELDVTTLTTEACNAENIFPNDPNSPLPIQQNTQPAATDQRYENGQIFGVTVSGKVTAVRFYAAAAEAGP